MSKIIILKNDRTGDLFVSTPTINKILNKHQSQKIEIFLSNINHKFSFLYPNINKRVINMDLNLIDKIYIFFYFLFNKISDVYILTPKNFYYYLPFFFRRIKFHGIVVNSERNRPIAFLRKYLYKYVIIDRINLKKRQSSYLIQSNLVENIKNEKQLLNFNIDYKEKFNLPKRYVFFHYKKNLFQNLLKWNDREIFEIINLLSSKFENVLFSSEYKDEKINTFFKSNFNTYDFRYNKFYSINSKNIYFLLDIDGVDLFNTVKNADKVVSPEGIISHMAYINKKPILAMLHFEIKNKKDIIQQLISCKEWFPPNNYDYIVLKKNLQSTIKKLTYRI